MANAAFRDVSFLLRRSHNEQVAKILSDQMCIRDRGYTLPKSLTRKMQIDGVRVFFVADNVALLTARKGLDPRQGYVAADNAVSYTHLDVYKRQGPYIPKI